jgi:hypothetical protein
MDDVTQDFPNIAPENNNQPDGSDPSDSPPTPDKTNDPKKSIESQLSDLKAQVAFTMEREAKMLQLLQDFVSQKSKPSFNETPESYQQIAQLLDDTLFQFKHHSDLATEYTQKHPELVSFKQPVMLMAAQLMREANAMGKPMTDREAIDQAVLTMQGHLASHVKGMQQKQQGDAMKRQALSFNVGQARQHVDE